jgi:hypothetical protein
VHVTSDLAIERATPFPSVPRHLLRRADLDPAAAASQHPQGTPTA